MKWIIVTGLSGAGKTVALRSLEDMGIYCIDNLPVSLLPAMVDQIHPVEDSYRGVAIGIDSRNIGLQNISQLLNELKQRGIVYHIIYLTASNAALIKRFSETRRQHPLSQHNLSLSEAIEKEKVLLSPLASQADFHIDTSQLNLYMLRDLIRLRVTACQTDTGTLVFQSFGFKYGLPVDADFVFDVRCLPNPHWQINLRSLTGKDAPVIKYFRSHEQVELLLNQLIEFLETWLVQFKQDNRHYLTIAIGCTGGKHRSVYITEHLYQHFRTFYPQVLLRHRELLTTHSAEKSA